jgi:hypothetical protein
MWQCNNRGEISARSNRVKLSVTDCDDLIEGTQTLLEHNSNNEQIRLLTIAPIAWDHNKMVNFFHFTEYQARAAIELRQTDGILAFPASLGGNDPKDRDTINIVLDYYRRDGISRPSPNRKDAVLINGVSVGKRFMEMTISQAFHSFSIENPSLKIRKSKFFALRLKDVKPEPPHDVC